MLAIAGGVTLSAALLYPYVGKELVPDDDQSEFSANLRLPRGTSFARTLEYVTPIEGELRGALGDNAGRPDGVDPERQRQLLGAAHADRRTQAVPARADAGGAPGAEQVPERAHQRVGRHRHLGRVERRRRPRRRWRRHEPADDDHAGPGRRGTAEALLCRLRPEGDDPGAGAGHAAREDPRDRRRHRFGHQLRADAARAAHHGRPQAGGRHGRAAGHALLDDEDADRRRRSFEVQGRRRAVFASGCGSTTSS